MPSLPLAARVLPPLLLALLAQVPVSVSAQDAGRALDQAMAAAEAALQQQEPQLAESHYRTALLEGWLLMGALYAAEGRLADARDALGQAVAAAVEADRARHALALVHLQTGEAAEAVSILTRLAARNPTDSATRRLLAQALVAAGRSQEAVQELEEARAATPDDPELAFALASGYLRVARTADAERLFAEVVRRRPLPQTHVLIGRTYRDFGHHDKARAELRAALKQDARVRRAHYYLGMLAVVEQGTAGLDEAIAEFGKELAIAPRDPLASLRLGMALVEAQRHQEALPLLERAAAGPAPPPDALHYLGRALLALEKAAAALPALSRALELSQGPQADQVRLGSIHYLLGLTLRALGRQDEAATHFAAAESNSAERTRGSREYLARYMADLPDTAGVMAALPAVMEASPVATLPATQRAALATRVRTALARSYLNLGVLHAQAARPARAAEELEKAAALEPAFPQVQYSLGVSYFNAGRFESALPPLQRALAAAPADAGLRRMVALARLNTGRYAEAADLLRDDPARESDPSLQYAYGLALVRGGRAEQAEPIFASLLQRHGDTAELNVVLGQAHAHQGDFDSAVKALEHALQLDPSVAEANASLALIHLKRGRLPEAEQALRAELRLRPSDALARHHLAVVLELQGRAEEALPLLREVLTARPEMGDARYLLGKILLARGSTAEALEHLEAAARLDPEAPNVRYQLGQAYQKLGRADQARGEFEAFQRLKDKARSSP